MRARTAILMLNLGGPKTKEEVRPFLINMFSDKTFIKIPFNLGPKIAKLRSYSVEKQYEAIGGSPLSHWSTIQGTEMCKILDNQSPETAPHKFYLSFRYSSPFAKEAIIQAQEDKAERIIAFTQYPHYSCATTGNSLRDLVTYTKPSNIEAIPSWSTHPSYINAWTQIIKEELAQFDNPQGIPLVFTAHSVPASVIWQGDRYFSEISNTVNRIMENFTNPHFQVWQSKVGFQQWLEPNTQNAAKHLLERGYKTALYIPIAFTSDHLETLFELDKEYVHQAKQIGFEVKRCKAPNDHPAFTQALADVVKDHLGGKRRNIIPRCLKCCHPELCDVLSEINQGVKQLVFGIYVFGLI